MRPVTDTDADDELQDLPSAISELAVGDLPIRVAAITEADCATVACCAALSAVCDSWKTSKAKLDDCQEYGCKPICIPPVARGHQPYDSDDARRERTEASAKRQHSSWAIISVAPQS